MIIGITGAMQNTEGEYVGIAGAGKDTVADYLVAKYRFASVALAAPLKEFCKKVFDFSDEQLWGPSEARNKPDKRYLRQKKGSLGRSDVRGLDLSKTFDAPYADQVVDGHLPTPREDIYLTPRHALQQLGTEWGRKCYDDIWVECALRSARVYATGGISTAIPDIRFMNELIGIKKAGGKLVRVVRQTGSAEERPYDLHVSESEVLDIPDTEFDYVLSNTSTIENLFLHVDRMMDVFTGKIRPYDAEQSDVPPFMRK